jgi:phosphohistidine phosphatase SixA
MPKAGNQNRVRKDIDRELTESGYQQASRMGRYLYLKELIPDKLFTSHARRAWIRHNLSLTS